MGDTIKVGDVVMLKSGGHFMTVVSIDAKDAITCAWSIKDDIKSRAFPLAGLARAEIPKTLAELVAISYQ